MAGYAKLFGSILFSTIWGESKDVKILWITLMAMADPDGVVEAAVPGLAAASRLSVDECRVAIAVLEAPDPDSKNPDHEGRRIEKCDGGWRLLNYLNYRDKLTVAHRREKTAERVRKFRERKAKEPPPVTADKPEHVAVPTDFDGSPNATTCPGDILYRFDKIVPEMVAKLPGSTPEQLRASATRCATYFTIGKGMGARRAFWMRIFREWVSRDHGEGKLKVNGERKPRNAGEALYARALKTLEEERKAAE